MLCRSYAGCCILYVGCCVLYACYAGTVWAFNGSAWDVALSMWDFAAYMHAAQAPCRLFHPLCGLSLEKTWNKGRDRRQGTKTLHYLVATAPLQVSARVSLANHSGACASDVRPRCVRPATITWNENRERRHRMQTENPHREPRQGTNAGHEKKEPRRGTKKGNQNTVPRQETKMENQEMEPKKGTKIGDQH